MASNGATTMPNSAPLPLKSALPPLNSTLPPLKSSLPPLGKETNALRGIPSRVPIGAESEVETKEDINDVKESGSQEHESNEVDEEPNLNDATQYDYDSWDSASEDEDDEV